MVLVHFPEGLAAKRLLLVGAGKPDKFAVADLRKIAGLGAALSEIARREELYFWREKGSAARRRRRR